MIQFILILLVCSCIGLYANPNDLENDRPKIHNEKRYEDLLGDPFNKRFLSIMLDPRSYDGPNSGFTVINLDEITWCREQGIKAFPILLEVLKREPSPNAGDHGEIRHSVVFKEHVLYYIKAFPEGDTRPFLEEVRRQLPLWSERQIPDPAAHTFIRQALDLLAREGDQSDIPLIESFLSDVDRNNKHNAQTSLTKLKERLSKESENKTRSSDRIIGNRNPTAESFTDEAKKNHFAKNNKFTNQNVILTLAIIIMLMIIASMVIKKIK